MAIGNGPVGVGIIGAGNISDQYLSNLTTFPDAVSYTHLTLPTKA